MSVANPLQEIPVRELVELAAVDDDLYCRTFFPETFRQGIPEFHRSINKALENPNSRYVAFKMFRGSAKTTKLRVATSKRLAYGLTRSGMFVSNAQKHAKFSLEWVKQQVDYNTFWARTFGLSRGKTWNDEMIEVRHGIFGFNMTLIAVGITGQVRGINIADYRPDWIVVDDPDNEETTNTPEQREKTSDLFFGALGKSLAPPSENPQAKMALAQTPFNSFDLITACENSPAWETIVFGCYDERGESRWPERFPTTFLNAEKEEHIRLRKTALWMREMECKIVSKENASFDADWLQYYDTEPLGGLSVITIDPASSESKTADDQVIMTVTLRNGNYYVRDYTAERGEMPDAAANTFFEHIIKYRPLRAAVETIGYQRVLKDYLEKEMRTRHLFVMIRPVQDQRRKPDRIVQAITGKAANKKLFIKSHMLKLVEQFTTYSPQIKMHDDVLDALAMALDELDRMAGMTLTESDGVEWSVMDDKTIPRLPEWRVSP